MAATLEHRVNAQLLETKMEKFVIEGGVPLSGTVTPVGNKNGALPILAACLLTDDEVILRNVPRISDVDAMVGLLESLGARVTWIGPVRSRSTPPRSIAPTSIGTWRNGSGHRSCWPGRCSDGSAGH
jgi:hypothetical protein